MRYAKPPATEVVFQMVSEGGNAWDLATPGLIYEKVQGTFGIRNPDVRVSLPLRVSVAQDADKAEMQPVSVIARFASSDQKSVLQIGEDILAVNRLGDYQHWEHFKQLISEGLAAYQSVVQPDHAHVLALGYANVLCLPIQATDLKEYLNVYPEFKGSSIQPKTFDLHISLPFENGRDVLLMDIFLREENLGGENRQKINFILTYITNEASAVPIAELGGWLDLAHERLNETFENSLTNAMKAFFDPVAQVTP